MEYLNINPRIHINTDEISVVCDTKEVENRIFVDAIDLSGGKKTTAIFLKTGAIIFVDLKVDTIMRRINTLKKHANATETEQSK